MDRKEQIRNAYRMTGKNADFYDGMMTCSTLSGRAICRMVWNMDQEKTLSSFEAALSGIPEDFSGRLLEVPVGTGVLTMPVYQSIPKAEITCLDSSERMMDSACQKARAAGITNIRFVKGDAGALTFADESFDLVLSLNGFHAFADKEAAWRETFRVLKKDGIFCGCFYIQGGCTRTDFMVRTFYEPAGYFTPPYETEISLKRRLSRMYREVRVTRTEGIASFVCRK